MNIIITKKQENKSTIDKLTEEVYDAARKSMEALWSAFLEVGELDMVRATEKALRLLVSHGDCTGAMKVLEGVYALVEIAPLEDFTDCQQYPALAQMFIMAMLGYVGGRFHAIGEKWYGRNPKNIEKGIPRANHMVMLNDVETGVPKCLITSNLLSAMRSAAAPALAAREMAPMDSKVIGLLGAGLLNRATLPCLLNVRPEAEEVRVYDIRADRSEAFCKEFSERFGINVHPVDSDEAAVRGCDIIHIAASGSNLPYIKREWLNQNALIVFNCSVPCDESVIDESNVSVDLYDAHVAWRNADPHQGLTGYRIIERVEDGRMKREDVMDLGAILAGKCQPKKDRPSMFIFHGMPPLDIALAHDVYTRAVEQGIGSEMPLWEKPHWF